MIIQLKYLVIPTSQRKHFIYYNNLIRIKTIKFELCFIYLFSGLATKDQIVVLLMLIYQQMEQKLVVHLVVKSILEVDESLVQILGNST